MAAVARLVLMCGLPGSGKTTAALGIARNLPALRLNPDEWLHNLGLNGYDAAARARVESLQWQLTQALLRLGINVVLEAGFWQRRERDSCRLRARELGAEVELRFLDVPTAELIERLRDRAVTSAVHSLPVTADQLVTWSVQFERPDPAELRLFDGPAADQ